jgi:hypothetical protein
MRARSAAAWRRWSAGWQLAARRLPLCGRLLCEMHAVLLDHPRGRGQGTRRVPPLAGVDRRHAAGQCGLRAAAGRCAAGLPRRFERFLNDEPEATPPLLKAALAHVQFETIHPFLDGNGRIGRLLIVLQLVADGVLREPLLYPSLFFKTHRALYYELLNEVRLNGDWERWLDFFAEGVQASATQGVSRRMRCWRW